MEVFWTILLSILSAVGLMTIFSWLMPCIIDRCCTFSFTTLMPLYSGEDLEWRLRWGFSLAKWGSGHHLKRFMLVDMGLTEEERQLCEQFCGDLGRDITLLSRRDVEELL